MTRKSITALIFLLIAVPGVQALAADPSPAFRVTNLPIPRFVSLASDKIYVRTGPGARYPIKWVFTKKNLPVEVILEYENWRKIRDFDGEEGWVHQSLITGRRNAIVEGNELVSVFRKPKAGARLNAYIEPGTVAALEQCAPEFCEIVAQGYSGWVQRKFIWGVYEMEIFD